MLMAGSMLDLSGGSSSSNSMPVLFENREFYSTGMEALLSPGSFPNGSLGSQFMMSSDEAAEDDFNECPQQAKKRRLTADQVQFLEKNFELENKLEPERKIQLAKDLGLNPRQVAIWFQNRRARWKTKQMEKEYESLKSCYDSLKVDCDNLLKEKEKLQSEVAFLTNKLLHKEKDKVDRLESVVRKKEDSVEAMVCKQEDISANSSMLDSESPSHCIDDGGYSKLMEPMTSSMNSIEPERWDLSEIDKVFGVGFRPEHHSCSFEFQVEDQPFWFWS
ncbi:homeobox-leucine zipper protein HAT5-like [Canna indica]|uniref:Homeobox-leucine zipper protein n=1 Tax=Canna indica TaxID=4628 RepID=A0AAQ3KJT6_9LILI|nr:homeobox-leucine zipper protein HAT5-like [Canna indica]